MCVNSVSTPRRNPLTDDARSPRDQGAFRRFKPNRRCTPLARSCRIPLPQIGEQAGKQSDQGKEGTGGDHKFDAGRSPTSMKMKGPRVGVRVRVRVRDLK